MTSTLSDFVLDAQVLALATTIHLAAAALRHHRAGGLSVLTAVSVLLAISPWVFPSIGVLVAGAVGHGVWFALCERWGRQQRPSAVARSGERMPVAATAAGGVTSSAEGRRSSPARAATPSSSGAAARAFVPAAVLSVLDETSDIRTLRLARPEGFVFSPGQFLTVRVRCDGRELVRCYSISTPPEASGYLEISVKRQGVVSGALHAFAKPGSSLTVRGPGGGFVYPADDDRPLLLVAGGIGITPVLSMLRHAVLAEPTRPATLVYSARQESDLAFRDELHSLARRSPRLRVILAASRGETSTPVYPGRIDRALLETVADVRESIACLCGPQAMIETLSGTLEELGLPRQRIRSELFEAAVAGSSRWTSDQAGRPTGGGVAVATAAIRMKATRAGREVEVGPGQTLLDAADAHGLSIPSLCRAGVCGTCRTRVVEGDVSCQADLLDDADRRAGYVLACVAHPLSDCVVEV